jgi:hypothetical protein
VAAASASDAPLIGPGTLVWMRAAPVLTLAKAPEKPAPTTAVQVNAPRCQHTDVQKLPRTSSDGHPAGVKRASFGSCAIACNPSLFRIL